MPLTWEPFDAEWQAPSSMHDEGMPLCWCILVTSSGMFSPDQSDEELLAGVAIVAFPTLAQTQAWCERREAELVESCKQTKE